MWKEYVRKVRENILRNVGRAVSKIMAGLLGNLGTAN
jgi:hypothetical protein